MANKIKALLVKPNELPKVVEIDTGLSNLQKAVGGYIETIYPFPDNVGLIMNEEGKLEGLPLKRGLFYENNLYDIVAGDFLVVGLTEDSFDSLTESQINKFNAYYYEPQLFMMTGSGIVAFPPPPEIEKFKYCIVERNAETGEEHCLKEYGYNLTEREASIALKDITPNDNCTISYCPVVLALEKELVTEEDIDTEI